MNLSIDSFLVDKKPNVDCSRQKPFICGFRCRNLRLPLIFYLKFANINFPRVCIAVMLVDGKQKIAY